MTKKNGNTLSGIKKLLDSQGFKLSKNSLKGFFIPICTSIKMVLGVCKVAYIAMYHQINGYALLHESLLMDTSTL